MAKMLLKYHGRTMRADPNEGEQFMLEIASGNHPLKDIENWIKGHMD